ncbi:enoyl-CoA hydratase/isomerase family protein [Corynebacterium propinquum]|uniref:enoyl-CoA hydratase/isomerase family protein n=1 Tax=Corynebacterium propinquum TaxID=43769 RepID=UPI0025416B0E|nr:enoyl-CoA hydratase/isomerase family protein [Corynebacterium propinquum]MDK4258127.1 enoyl-CoA hydratase/isomerase family protein [Corynebacterium propinquum]MDK4281277.1 enoyl-CoA hydratase/isomerase family protein [Corynebacterium propinquum]MDK4298177.1 enoyl-CoA hydratase/isomerase family protein [Corynebacterium propinquum]
MTSSAMTDTQDRQVITSVRNGTGILELNRPKALNSLNLEMVEIIHQALDAWAENDSVTQVLIYSNNPKGFCAGGDVRAAREQSLAGNKAGVDEFFRKEYALNDAIDKFPKPFIALMDGVVMGGGTGISAFGSHRVVTEKTFVSMPEMLIGFITDVGMTYFFQRMVGSRGKASRALALYLATTAYRMKAADLLWTGYATHQIASDDADAFREAVIESGYAAALEKYANTNPDTAPLAAQIETIEEVFAQDSWADVVTAVKQCEDQEFVAGVNDTLKHASPTSLVAAAEIFRANAQIGSLADALDNEYRVGEYLRGRPDFDEGVRCVLVDKGDEPQFQPDAVSEVDVDTIRALLR